MKKLLLLFIPLLLLMVSCSNDEDEADKNAKSHDKHTIDSPEKEGEADVIGESEFIYPLSGEEASEKVNERIVAVMVNNHPKARPQTGLSHADVVFEMLAEGNITRFMALFQSDIPERVGPVRSARPYYFNVADGYNAIYVYHGAANYIEDMIQNGAVEGLNGMYHDNDKVLFERSSDRVAPHNSYTIFDGIYENAKKKGYALEADYEPLPFDKKKEVTGESVGEIQLEYGRNSVKYIYDEKEAHYVRYSDGIQTVEKSDNTPIELNNIMILETPHQVIDDVGRREIDLKSGGDALLLQRGKVQHVQWERIDGRIIPTKEGKPVPFIPGQTWINVIPTKPGIDGVQLSKTME